MIYFFFSRDGTSHNVKNRASTKLITKNKNPMLSIPSKMTWLYTLHSEIIWTIQFVINDTPIVKQIVNKILVNPFSIFFLS